MATPYKLAFTPGRIGNLELKHRLINSPSIPNFSKRNGQITQREIDYYVEKAKGGYALVFVSATSVNDTTARSFTNQPGIQDDAFLAGWRQMAEEIHKYGAKCGAQIFHPGSQNHPKYCRPGSVPEAPSNVPCDMEAAIPGYQLNEMSKERIREVIDEFAEAARRVKDAGFDLVEIHGAHGYLPMQFFSPQTNKRTDEYGGDFAGRTRFIAEVMRAIREKVGPSYTVGIRISVDELVEGGVTLEETRGYARFLEQLGFAYISVSLGLYTPLGLYLMLLGPYSAPGHEEPYAAAIKQEVKIPVFQYGGFTHVGQAEQILANGSADFVIMNRASIADPHIIRKTLEGDEDDIRPCIRCNDGCVHRLFGMRDITCTMNPELGREREFADKLARKAARRKKVMVIGGGPGGMAAAKYARLMGHSVSLFEREAELGGLIRYSGRGPGRETWAEVATYYAREVNKLGIEISLNTEVTPEMVRSLTPDAIVVATGAGFSYPPIKGLRTPDGKLAANVVACPDAILGNGAVGKRVVIVGGNAIGVHAARLLSEQGKQVTIVEAMPQLNQDLDGPLNWYGFILSDIEERKIKVMTHSLVREITPEGAIVEASGDIPPLEAASLIRTVDTEQFIACDTVVVGTSRKSRNELFDRLAGAAGELYIIGDAVKPRWAYNAIGEGATVGINL